MKKNLFTLILCSMLLVQLPAFAKNITIHNSKPHSAQRGPLPVQAFLTDRLLMIQPCAFESDFTVTITKSSTSEIVFEQSYEANTNSVNIDLSIEESGEYTIQLSSANWLIYGDFNL